MEMSRKPAMGSARVCWLLLLFAVAAVCKVSQAKFSYGKEAEKLCQNGLSAHWHAIRATPHQPGISHEGGCRRMLQSLRIIPMRRRGPEGRAIAYKKICPRGKVCAIQTMEIHRTIKFPVCVHQRRVQVRSRVCRQAPSPGGCRAQFRRWYYNVHMAACSWFTYGGCGGNDNNFRSREECERVCVTGKAEQADDDMADLKPRRHNRVRVNSHHQHSRRRHQPRDPARRSHEHATIENSDSSMSRHSIYNSQHNRTPKHGHSMNKDSDNMHGSRDHSGRSNTQPPDMYDGERIYTTISPTTPLGDIKGADQSNRNRLTSGGSNRPLELRRPPVEHRRIRTKPKPHYRHHGAGRDMNRPAALQIRPLPSEHRGISHTSAIHDRTTDYTGGTSVLTDFPEKARSLTNTSDRPQSLTNFPDKPVSLSNSRNRPQSLTNLPERFRSSTNFPERPRALTNFPDTSRRRSNSERLAGVPAQTARLPTATIRRRVSRVSSRREPLRTLSLLSREDPYPARTRAPARVSDMTDVTSGLTAVLKSSYASGASEKVRRFPARRYRKKNRGKKRKPRRHRRRKYRRRFRKYRTGRQRTPAYGRSINYANNADVTKIGNDENGNTTGNGNQTGRAPSRHYAEFRRKKTSYWPEKTQSDEANQDLKMSTSDPEGKGNGKKRRRQRRRRRKNKHGRRAQRGRNRGRDQGHTTVTASTRMDESSRPMPAENQYYDSIHLFGILDTANNETDIMT